MQIRTIIGTTACCTVKEEGPHGSRRYTVRCAWPDTDVVVTVEGIAGQHRAQRLANRMAEALTPAALVPELEPDAPRDGDGSAPVRIPQQDAQIRTAAQIPAGSSGREIEGSRIDSIGMGAAT